MPKNYYHNYSWKKKKHLSHLCHAELEEMNELINSQRKSVTKTLILGSGGGI